MGKVKVSVELKSKSGVVPVTIRVKDTEDGTRATVELTGGKGSFQASVGSALLVTRYVIGPIGARYTLALSVPKGYEIEPTSMEGEVWKTGWGLASRAARVQEEAKS
jgi:hypothetical protein